MATLERGTVVDSRFEVLEVVGHGGMGIVYRARQKDIDRSVALKMLKPALLLQPEKMKRFQREAHLVSKLDHPNIVRIYTVGLDEKQPYIAMEFLSGRHLNDIIAEEGPLSWHKALPLFMQLCDALSYAHEQHVIHRDIKPSNIVVVTNANNEVTAKLVDFGIAKSLVDSGPAITETDMVLGSVFYLSPGQFEGREADQSADIYSLGCTFFEVLSGKPPFVGSTVFSTIHKSANDQFPKVENIPQALQTLMEAMTAKSAETRVSSAAVVRRNLEAIAEGRNIEPQLLKAAIRDTRKKAVKPVVVAMSLLLALAAIVGRGWMLSHQPTVQTSEGASIAQLLTKLPVERTLVEHINSSIGTKPVGQLANEYEQLANVYRNADLNLASRSVALEGFYFGHENLKNPDTINCVKQVALNDLALGNINESALLLSKLNLMLNNQLDIGLIGHEMQNAVLLGDYNVAASLYERAKSRMLDDEESPGMRAIMWRTAGLVMLRLKRYSEAAECFAQWRRRTNGNIVGNYDELRTQIEEMLALTGMQKPISPSQYNEVNERVVALRNVPSYSNKLIAWTLSAELMIRQGHREEGLRRARQVIDIVASAPDTVEVSHELDFARVNLLAIQQLLNKDQSAQLADDVKRLDSRMKSLHRTINNTGTLRIPVPTPHAASMKELVDKL